MSDKVSIVIICLLYTFSKKKKSAFTCNYMGIFDVSCGMFSIIIVFSPGPVLRDMDMDSDNINLMWLFASDGQKTCSSKGVSRIAI